MIYDAVMKILEDLWFHSAPLLTMEKETQCGVVCPEEQVCDLRTATILHLHSRGLVLCDHT